MQPLRKFFRIRYLAILVMAGIVTCTAACSGSSGSATTMNPYRSTGGGSSTSAAGLGLYDGKFGPSGIKTAATWLGSSGSIKYAQDFIDARDWSHIANPWQLSNWKGTSYTMIWGVPMLPCGSGQSSTQCGTNVSDYDLVASGGADSYFKTLAQNLVANGFGSSYIRLGWEFNASWMGWSICNDQGSGLDSWAKDFVPAFQNIVTTMRGVSPNFKFIWNPLVSSNASCPGGNLEKYYPGDKYVDAVALDIYDGVGQTVKSDSARFDDLVNGVNGGQWTSVVPEAINGQKFKGYGLTWLTAFGKEHSKLISIPEWGLDTTSQESGGGDDAYFITHMADWLKANATGPQIFWNFGEGNLPLDIPNYTNGPSPQATAAFKAAFGVSG